MKRLLRYLEGHHLLAAVLVLVAVGNAACQTGGWLLVRDAIDNGIRAGDEHYLTVIVAVYLGVADKIEPPGKLEGYGYDPERAQILPVRLADALDALEADRELADVLGGYFVSSFLAYKRNEIERFERYVTDWEFREYAYHL